jgi:hypothetical protein
MREQRTARRTPAARSKKNSRAEEKQVPVAQFGADSMAGAFAGREFVKQMIANASPYDLGWRVLELIKKGTFGGFEVGFFDEIAHLACGSPMLDAENNAFNHGRDPGPIEDAPPASA